jgi:hypothetical protein
MKLSKLGVFSGVAALTVTTSQAQLVVASHSFSNGSNATLNGVALDFGGGVFATRSIQGHFGSDGLVYNSTVNPDSANTAVGIPINFLAGQINRFSLDVGYTDTAGGIGIGLFNAVDTDFTTIFPTNDSNRAIVNQNGTSAANRNITFGGVFAGITGQGNSLTHTSQTLSLEVDARTSGAWTVEVLRNGSPLATRVRHTYGATNPTFTHFSFRIATTSTGTGFVDNFVHTVPEPSAALLGGLGVLALIRRRR